MPKQEAQNSESTEEIALSMTLALVDPNGKFLRYLIRQTPLLSNLSKDMRSKLWDSYNESSYKD
jgi:hypothetical protein